MALRWLNSGTVPGGQGDPAGEVVEEEDETEAEAEGDTVGN